MVFHDFFSLSSLFVNPYPNGSAYYDQIGGIPLINCPNPGSALGKDEWFHHPTVLITYILLGCTSLGLAILVSFKYNSVKVFNKVVRTQYISNTLWIFYFLSVCARTVFDSVRYGLDVVYEDSDENSGLFFSYLVMDGIASLCLGLALNHQYKYRTSQPTGSKDGLQQKQMDRKSLSSKSHDRVSSESRHSKKNVPPMAMILMMVTEIVLFTLFFVYLVFLYLNVTSPPNRDAFYWVFLAACIAQKVPIIILTGVICANEDTVEGTTLPSKIALVLGTLTTLALFVPPSLITEWMVAANVKACPLNFASWVDLLQWIYISSLGFYFYFLKSEYSRNVEECIWTTVSEIQDSFDFRRF